MAGGLNLYGYGNGDPINRRDPFGLCTPPANIKQGQVGICVQGFIKDHLRGAGDNRTARSDGGSNITSEKFTVDATAGLSACDCQSGRTFGIVPGAGGIGIGGTATSGGWDVSVVGSARNGLTFWLDDIDFSFSKHVDKSGNVSIRNYSHDAFPSFEIWAYSADGTATLVYHHEDSGRTSDLKGDGTAVRPTTTKQKD